MLLAVQLLRAMTALFTTLSAGALPAWARWAGTRTCYGWRHIITLELRAPCTALIAGDCLSTQVELPLEPDASCIQQLKV